MIFICLLIIAFILVSIVLSMFWSTHPHTHRAREPTNSLTHQSTNKPTNQQTNRPTKQWIANSQSPSEMCVVYVSACVATIIVINASNISISISKSWAPKPSERVLTHLTHPSSPLPQTTTITLIWINTPYVCACVHICYVSACGCSTCLPPNPLPWKLVSHCNACAPVWSERERERERERKRKCRIVRKVGHQESKHIWSPLFVVFWYFVSLTLLSAI